jgi:hypothetical protein
MQNKIYPSIFKTKSNTDFLKFKKENEALITILICQVKIVT